MRERYLFLKGLIAYIQSAQAPAALLQGEGRRTISAFVDKLSDSLQRRISISNERLDGLEHLNSSLVDLDENSVVKLTETEETQDHLRLRRQLVDTLDTSRKNNLRLRLLVESSCM